MASILVLYATKEGQTRTIAEFIADVLKDEGHQVTQASVKDALSLKQFEVIVLGASIHFGRYPDYLYTYVKDEVASLNTLQSAFFSVCLTASRKDTLHIQQAQSYIDSFLAETQWQPNLTKSFAGALKFTQYGFFKTQVMKAIAKKEQLSVNTKQDFEYTEWEEVTRFALRISDTIRSEAQLNQNTNKISDLKPYA